MFRSHVLSLNFRSSMNLALYVTKDLFPGYNQFVESEKIGDGDLLIDAIRACEDINAGRECTVNIRELRDKIDLVIPDTDDYDNPLVSYALNAGCSVLEMLDFVEDQDPSHIINIGEYFTDSVDLKIQELNSGGLAESDDHPMMINARETLMNIK